MRSILVLMAAVAIAFAAVIWFGFWIHERSNAIPDNVFGPLAYIAIFGIALFLTCAALRISPWSGWTVQEMFGPRRPRWKIRWRPARVTALSAAQKAYLANPEATATCVHLQPIERAMRRAGIEVRLLGGAPIISAACRIHEPELKRVFLLPASIQYRETDRADIVCGYCFKNDRSRCDIQVLHPEERKEGAVWFPSAP